MYIICDTDVSDHVILWTRYDPNLYSEVSAYTVSYENNVDYITERRAYLSNQIITSLWKLPASKTQSQSD